MGVCLYYKKFNLYYIFLGTFFEAYSNELGEPYEIAIKFDQSYSEIGTYAFEFYANMYCNINECINAKDYILVEIERSGLKNENRIAEVFYIENINDTNWALKTFTYTISNQNEAFKVCPAAL